MCQKSAKGFIMLLFLATAACLAAIHQAVIGNVCLVAAIALAMPDHKALCVTLFRGVLRSQPAEPLAGDIGHSIVPRAHAPQLVLRPDTSSEAVASQV